MMRDWLAFQYMAHVNQVQNKGDDMRTLSATFGGHGSVMEPCRYP